MPSNTCHFNLQSINWCVVFFFTSHITSQSLNYVCQLMCILFLCKFLHVNYQKLAKTLSKIHIVIQGPVEDKNLSLFGKPNSKPGPMLGPKLIGGFSGLEVFGIWSLNNETCAHQGKCALKRSTLEGSLFDGLQHFNNETILIKKNDFIKNIYGRLLEEASMNEEYVRCELLPPFGGGLCWHVNDVIHNKT